MSHQLTFCVTLSRHSAGSIDTQVALSLGASRGAGVADMSQIDRDVWEVQLRGLALVARRSNRHALPVELGLRVTDYAVAWDAICDAAQIPAIDRYPLQELMRASADSRADLRRARPLTRADWWQYVSDCALAAASSLAALRTDRRLTACPPAA